jgi:tRNA modification GTPase
MFQTSSLSKTCCALLTPQGRGAIAVIAVFGDQSVAQIDALFQSATGKTLCSAAQQTIFYGTWRSSGEDVLVIRLPDRMEIHCHGGQAAPTAILRSLEAVGVLPLSDFEAARQLHGPNWQAYVALALTRSATERTAEILLNQLNKAPQLLSRLQELITSSDSSDLDLLRQKLAQSLHFASFGLHLSQPWSVVLCGKTNVGKSSLINALVGFERAIVHHEAGTTRDVVTQLTAVEGWPIELKDTAGLRETQNPVEQQGLRFSHAEIKQADLAIAVFDAQQTDLRDFDWPFVVALNAKILVLNKIDLVAHPIAECLKSRARNRGHDLEIIETSATNQQGINGLIQSIARNLVSDPPPEETLIPVAQRQVELLEECVNLVESNRRDEARALIDRWLCQD